MATDVAPAPASPELDVSAVRRVLDGRYAEVRDLVRSNLADHALWAVLDRLPTHVEPR